MFRSECEGASSWVLAVMKCPLAYALESCVLLPFFLRGILTASYAGTMSLNSSTLPPPSNLTFIGHDLSVLSCCYVPHPLGTAGKQWVASGGMDRIGRVWEYDVCRGSMTIGRTRSSHFLLQSIPAAIDSPLPVPTTLYTLLLHDAPISSVRSRPLVDSPTPTPSPHLLTAGWDGIVGVWDLTPGVNEGEPEVDGTGERRKKRRKQAPGIVISKVRFW
mgnify:FL=1